MNNFDISNDKRIYKFSAPTCKVFIDDPKGDQSALIQ